MPRGFQHYMYEDGGNSLADKLRYRDLKTIAKFLQDVKPNANHLSSCIMGDLWEMYGGDKTLRSIYFEPLKVRLAHASREWCSDITSRTDVLCIYRNDRNRLEFHFHKAGQCDHVQDWIKNALKRDTL